MDELYEYAVAHYEEGGHWVAETWVPADYNELLQKCGGDMAKAKKALKARWILICEQERNCAW